MNYFYRIYPYLIILISFATGVVFFSAIDCVLAWYNAREATNFELASLLYMICALALIPITVKYSCEPDPYEKAEDETHTKNKK
jgi:hypothetical protein